MGAGLSTWIGAFSPSLAAMALPFGRLITASAMLSPADKLVIKDLVLVGGGHSHVIVLKSFAMKPLPGVRITLVARDVLTPYSGMLPGFVGGHYSYEDCHIDLRPLAELCGARLIHCPATGIDLEDKNVLLDGHRPPVKFDVVSIDIGITPKQSAVGSSLLTVPVKPIDSFTSRWTDARNRILAAPPGFSHTIVVVGGGAGGVELLLAMQHRLMEDMRQREQKLQQQQQESQQASELSGTKCMATELKFVLITRGDLLPTHNRRVRAMVGRILDERKVTVILASVTGVQPASPQVDTNSPPLSASPAAAAAEGKRGVLLLDNGQTVAFNECMWCTQGAAAGWLQGTGLALDSQGFIRVNACLQSVSHPPVFAAGDVHSSDTHPRPKAGVIAVRQGMPLADNLRRALTGQPLKPFHPQSSFLSLLSTGDKYAIASRGWLALEGAYLWTWKDSIDRSFMRKFNELPDMPAMLPEPNLVTRAAGVEALAVLSSLPMRCGGCGSKVGSSILSRTLKRLSLTVDASSDDTQVLIGLQSPDDAAVVRLPTKEGMVLIQTVDCFRSFISDPFTFGRIAAVHALSDIFAMGASPATALAIVTLPPGTEEKIGEDLFQLLSGASLELQAASCQLVGGHTAEGEEMSLGFAVSGYCEERKLLRKSSMQVGDELILTKPIGTGVILAANMRHKAKGRWVSSAVTSMLQSNQAAADLALRFNATAATDVTGFGLLGHLVEMASASDVQVEVDLQIVPAQEGALECIADGVFSSLQESNFALRRAVSNLHEVLDSDRFKLLFDPQTSGGLLLSVPKAQALPCLQSLHDGGMAEAAIIGRVTGKREDPAGPTVRILNTPHSSE